VSGSGFIAILVLGDQHLQTQVYCPTFYSSRQPIDSFDGLLAIVLGHHWLYQTLPAEVICG
jgi:hypothetical protein